MITTRGREAMSPFYRPRRPSRLGLATGAPERGALLRSGPAPDDGRAATPAGPAVAAVDVDRSRRAGALDGGAGSAGEVAPQQLGGLVDERPAGRLVDRLDGGERV